MSGPIKENDLLPITQSNSPLKFRFGEAKRCLEALVCECDMNNARDEIKKNEILVIH